MISYGDINIFAAVLKICDSPPFHLRTVDRVAILHLSTAESHATAFEHSRVMTTNPISCSESGLAGVSKKP
jgi:hypothetical protein